MTDASASQFSRIWDEAENGLLLVTGPSGAGRSTAIHALEDFGYEVIDNLPLSLFERLIGGPALERPLALGIDVRNRDFSVDALISLLERHSGDGKVKTQLLYLDCEESVLRNRFSETRRRHPLAPDQDPGEAISAEKLLLLPIRARADILIDTTQSAPQDLRAELARYFARKAGQELAITVQSFSYKRGLPRGSDMVLDCRFLRNPHWEQSLRKLTGLDRRVRAHIEDDSRYETFLAQTRDLVVTLLPAFQDEGKSYFSIAFGCTGGKHRSVTLAENFAQALAKLGWEVAIRHRELERLNQLMGKQQGNAG